ncbi:MAG: hypothetical protein JWO37_2514 [Acidimicrobiales bacterium]|jgi:uncharacterized protein (TIGR03083 family)|nr:hypothetical protein [Acidimicrobiales bacterium]
MGEIGTTYAEGRARITDLVRDIDDAHAEIVVATCPSWSVHDVLAHLSGVCADILGGNIAGVATDPWTAAQVDARRDRTVAELLGEWDEVGPQVEAIADVFPGRTGRQLVLDLTTHEHDIRLALGTPGARDSGGVAIGAEFVAIVGLGSGLATLGVGPLEIRAGDRTWIAGTGSPVAAPERLFDDVLLGADPPAPTTSPVGTLDVDAFELFRAMTGRRSGRQIRAYDWSVDPAPYLPVFSFGPFTTSPTDIVE